jgi:hypothetical protein
MCGDLMHARLNNVRAELVTACLDATYLLKGFATGVGQVAEVYELCLLHAVFASRSSSTSALIRGRWTPARRCGATPALTLRGIALSVWSCFRLARRPAREECAPPKAFQLPPASC